MDIKKIDDITYKVDGKELWYHTVKRVWFCWDCGRFDCDHVEAVREHLAPAPSHRDAVKG